MKLRLFSIFCACVALIIPLHAQTAGRLAGSVVDQSGAAVPNARVGLFLHGSSTAVITAQTTSDGFFAIGTIRPELYDLTVEAAGFATAKIQNVKIDAAAETSLPAIRVEVASSSQSVQVTENVVSVNTTTIEIDKSITKSQLEELPALDRQVSTLFLTQTGVTEARGAMVINGMRTTSTNVTYDGVNIQDNFIRGNSLDFIPNKTTLDQVQEVTLSTSNPNPALGNGASQVIMVTPSGNNTYHGSLYYYYRNAKFAATDWFANQTGAGKAPLKLNQFGGTVGGPIKKDKLLFYFNYEGFREVTSSPFNNTVLTAAARKGLLTYKTTAGATQQLNVLQAAGLGADSTVGGILSQIPLPNNNNVGDGLNTAGYEINEPFNENRKTFSGKIDYYLSQKHVFSGSYNFNTDDVLRPDGLLGYFGGPVGVQNNNKGKLLSASWRWTPTSRLTNELRGGFNIASLPFNVTGAQPASYLTDGLISLPGINWSLFPQGRNSKVFSLQDNATYVRGKHTIYFGYQTYVLHEQPFTPNGNVVPAFGLSIQQVAPFQFTTNNIPGTQATYVGAANNLLATLGGIIGTYSQQFNITSQTSGYVPNALSNHNFVYNTYSGYVADNYKVLRRVTINAGLRYDYWTPVYDSQGLFFEPTLENHNATQTILDSNAVLNFIGNPGHPFYNASKKNFSPNVGFAWDVFGDGKTSVRGGYSLSFFNDDTILSVIDAAGANAGTSATVANNNAYSLLKSGLPTIQTPKFTSPLPIATNFQLNSANGEAIIDPNLKTPYYQQFNIGIERQVKNTVFDLRYLGNHGTRLLQGFDQNQVNINANGFLGDFINAQNNGFLSQAAGKGFNPSFNSAIAGSKPLPVFATLPGGGLLTNGTVINDILRGEVGTLAQLYQQNGLNGPINFFQNSNELLGRVLTNYANSTYNALQAEARGKLTKDLQFQFSYVYGKVMTDSPGTPQGNINDLLTLNNGRIERGRASFDDTHVFKANYIYNVPLGAGHRFMSKGFMDRIFGGWTTSAFITHQSGNPFTVLDPLGTLNRAARATFQTANINGTTKGQLDAVVGNRTYINGNGVYFVNPSILSPAGQGVAPFGSPNYSGQLFFNPSPGQVGNLQLEQFSGPWATNANLSLQKTFKLFERHTLQFRADFFNVFNHASFEPSADGANASVQSTTFGKSPADLFGPRVIQFALHYRF
jgi:hypothetical protein